MLTVVHKIVLEFEKSLSTNVIIPVRTQDERHLLRFYFRDVTLPIEANENDEVEFGGQRPDGRWIRVRCKRIQGDIYEGELRREDLMTAGEMTLQVRVREPEKENEEYRKTLYSPPFDVVITKPLKVWEETEADGRNLDIPD